jgi:tRNA(Ile)-lysidine synthase
MEGSRKLQDYFTDRGVDAPWRDEIPLLCRGNEVLLAAGIGAGAVPPWREDAGNIRLEWQGELPWKNSNGKEKD